MDCIFDINSLTAEPEPQYMSRSIKKRPATYIVPLRPSFPEQTISRFSLRDKIRVCLESRAETLFSLLKYEVIFVGFHIHPVIPTRNRLAGRRTKSPPVSNPAPRPGGNPLLNTGPIEDFIHAPIDVLNMRRNLLCTCRPVKLRQYELILERVPGALSLPVLNPGTDVYIDGYTKDLTPIILKAQVHNSNRICLILGKISNELKENERASFRQPIRTPAELFKETDKNRKNSIPCVLKNISEGGACVVSEHDFELDAAVLLRVELYPKAGPISFSSQIIRKNPTDKSIEYGLLFAQVDERKLNSLRWDMEEVRELIRKRTYC